MADLAAAIFRANPDYELVLLDRLEPAERALAQSLAGNERVYGLLRPRAGASLEPRVASHDTALLLFTLQQSGPLPAYVAAELGMRADSVVARLVLDGVLEIEDDGGFRAGAAARDLVLGPSTVRERGRIGDLSIEALQYGQALRSLPAPHLAERLYFFNHKPASPPLRHRFPDERAVRRQLGLHGGRLPTVIAEGWTESQDPAAGSFWRMWRPRGAGSARTGPGYKLYVSPGDDDALADALLAVAETLLDVPGARGFKVGRNLAGLCRPDKLVAYFARLADLHTAAQRVRERLEGMPVHGVPFTAEVTRDGLLSWGIDPPPATRAAAPENRGSWRFWVVNKLAEYLLTATTDGVAQPWQFALDRLLVDGVDTDTWVPAGTLWDHPAAAS